MRIWDIDSGMVTLGLHPDDCFFLARTISSRQEHAGKEDWAQLDALFSLFQMAGIVAEMQSSDWEKASKWSLADLLKDPSLGPLSIPAD